ncbi:MAG: HAD family phosphatase [Polyangiales bacterium]
MTTGVVLFDLDGVLVNSAPLHVRAYEQVFSEAGIAFPEAARTAVNQGKPRADVIDIAAPGASDEIRRALFDAKPSAVMRVLEGQDVAMPGALHTLREIASEGFPIGVVTNSATPGPWLGAAHLSRYVAVVVGREDVSEPKPSPEGYFSAARQLDVPTSRCVVVEDSRDGWLAATRAGMHVFVLAPQRPGWVDADTEVLPELAPAVLLRACHDKGSGGPS